MHMLYPITECGITISHLANHLFDDRQRQWCFLEESTNLVVFGGATTAANTSLGCPGAPMDLLYLPRFLGEGGCGRPREKVALLLAGRTESLRGLIGGGGGWGRDTFGLRFLRLSSITVFIF